MSQIMQMLSLLLMLVTGSTSMLAKDGRADASTTVAREAIHQRLNSSSIYERRKALDELMIVAPDDPVTVAVLVRQFQSPDAEEARFSDFMQRVERALQNIASKTIWPPENVELLTSVLVHNDAYDAMATNRTASTVAGVALHQAFSLKAIDDLTTVLWHRVDRNPNRTRSDNTRTYVVRALRHISRHQGLPQSVIDASLASLSSEGNASVRRETVLLFDEYARAQPASDALVQALTEVLYTDDKAVVRSLAARSLRSISAQRDHPRSMIHVLLQAVAGDPDIAVRREALTGLMAAAAAHSLAPEALPPEVMERLLRAAAWESDARVRFQVLQALGKVYATQGPDPATLKVLLERLSAESDRRVRGLIAVTLQEIHERQRLDPAVLGPLIPLVTDAPEEEVRQAISRMLIEPPAGQDLADWMKATGGMGLTPAAAATTVMALDMAPRDQRVEQISLLARLLTQYVSALSGARDRAVREEILQGLFAQALAEPLPQQAVDVLARSLESEPDAGLRLQVAAVLLHNSLQTRDDIGVFYPVLDDSDARVRDYAAFALLELSAVDGDVLPGLLDTARDPSAHRNLRWYSLRRLAQWRGNGRDLPESVQAALLELTGEPDVELRQETWNALRQFDLAEQDWRRAAADDDIAIRRMGWRQLESLGVSKPVWAKWRDPKQRLGLIAGGLLGATLLAVVASAVLFCWRLLLWWRCTREQGGKCSPRN